MDINGPCCERLLASAFDGPTARRVRFARFPFTVRQVPIGKAPGQLVLDGRRQGCITCHRMLRAVRLRFRCAIAFDGHVAELEVGNLEIQGALESWLARVGGLAEIAGYRSVDQATCFWPSEATLDLLDLEGWRGEAAFLVANLMLGAVRRYVAVRPPEEGDPFVEASPETPAHAGFRVHTAA